MNFSFEEIYSMYGQYDTFVVLEFHYNSDEYKFFGCRLMGVFKYAENERIELERVLQLEQTPRTDIKTKFYPSSLEKLTNDKIELLDRFGLQCSSINAISAYKRSRKNRFKEIGIKEIPNQITIQLPKIGGWQQLNRLRFNFLNTIYISKKPFAPYQEIEYWGLRKHLGFDLDKEDYKLIKNRDSHFLQQIRLIELSCKLNESGLHKEEIKEWAYLRSKKMKYKQEIIESEIIKSGEKMKNVMTQFNVQLEELKKCCNSFDEENFCFGEKPIYLSFDRFVHIFARHVSETQIGERFSSEKTVFQYKLENIMYLIKMVVETVSSEIQEHFKRIPEQPFKRIGKRAVYIDGHYYRLEIETNGSILNFHPYN